MAYNKSFLQTKNAHPRDSRIEFIEETHQYILDGGAYVFPRSVSGFVGKFFSHFDAKGVIKKNIKKWKSVPLDDDEDVCDGDEEKDPTKSKRKYRRLFDAFNQCFPNCNEDDECEFLCRVWKTNGERQSCLGTSMHLSIEIFLNEISDREGPSGDFSTDCEFVCKKEEGDCSSSHKENVVDGVFCSNKVDDNDENRTNTVLPNEIHGRHSSRLEDLTLLKILVNMFSLWEEDAKRLIVFYKDGLFCSSSSSSSSRLSHFVFDRYSFEMSAWLRWWETAKDELVPFRTEWSVFSEEHDIAGQIDAVFQRRNDDDNKALVLVDWKRVAIMDYGEDDGIIYKKFGKKPFDRIPDTNFGHYTLQLNLYAMILERFYGFRVVERFLVQIHPSLPYPGYKIHPIKKI